MQCLSKQSAAAAGQVGGPSNDGFREITEDLRQFMAKHDTGERIHGSVGSWCFVRMMTMLCTWYKREVNALVE